MNEGSVFILGCIFSAFLAAIWFSPYRSIEASHVKLAEEKCANNNGLKQFSFKNSKIFCNNGAVFEIDDK